MFGNTPAGFLVWLQTAHFPDADRLRRALSTQREVMELLASINFEEPPEWLTSSTLQEHGKIVGLYLTRSGKEGMRIRQEISRDGRITYAYTGEWGAGSGHPREYIAREVEEALARRRGVQVKISFSKRVGTKEVNAGVKHGPDRPVDLRKDVRQTQPGETSNIETRLVLKLAAQLQEVEEPDSPVVSWANQEKAQAYYNDHGFLETTRYFESIGGSYDFGASMSQSTWGTIPAAEWAAEQMARDPTNVLRKSYEAKNEAIREVEERFRFQGITAPEHKVGEAAWAYDQRAARAVDAAKRELNEKMVIATRLANAYHDAVIATVKGQ